MRTEIHGAPVMPVGPAMVVDPESVVVPETFKVPLIVVRPVTSRTPSIDTREPFIQCVSPRSTVVLERSVLVPYVRT